MTAESAVEIRPFEENDAAAWDDVVRGSSNGTLQHTRRFLSYHGSRFSDRSVVVLDARGRWLGVLPAAVEPSDADVVTSHPGLTYGGLVHGRGLGGERVMDALQRIAAHFASAGFQRFRYKATPWVYHRLLCAEDVYALFRLGARRYRCDLSATLLLADRPAIGERRRSAQRRASRCGVEVRPGTDMWPQFWKVLESNLRDRHHVAPTHSLSEIQLLRSLFPEEIVLVVGQIGADIVAGTVLFQSGAAMHLRYEAADDRGRQSAALDPVLEASIRLALAKGCRHFEFGISTEDQGRVLNSSLDDFKRSFGAGGTVYEHYELDL